MRKEVNTFINLSQKPIQWHPVSLVSKPHHSILIAYGGSEESWVCEGYMDDRHACRDTSDDVIETAYAWSEIPTAPPLKDFAK
jgi:hypothetical protein